MEGEWETVKQKKAPTKKKTQATEHKPQFGGKGAKGKLIAGPIQQMNNTPSYQNNDFTCMNNQASNIADFDYHIDSDEEEQKFEAYSQTCSNAVKQARAKAGITQDKLATMIGEKNVVVHEVENGKGRYVAGVINSIEKALNCKIPRGRGRKGGR